MKRRTLSILAVCLFFACNKQLSDNKSSVKASSKDNLYQQMCITYGAQTYYTQCYPDGGPNNSYTCSSTAMNTPYTVCYETTSSGAPGNVIGSSWGGGGSAPSGDPLPAPKPVPILNTYPEQNNYLCGDYRWKKIGDAYYAQFKGLGFTFVHGDGSMVEVGMGIGGIMVPANQIINTAEASEKWNRAWNNAMTQLWTEVNTGITPPDDAHPC
ncbi:MAG: hypothetical protein JO072_05600 [Parafilimonas sp.]|nr:hypothetical protein [Parafilimonas sp.]